MVIELIKCPRLLHGRLWSWMPPYHTYNPAKQKSLHKLSWTDGLVASLKHYHPLSLRVVGVVKAISSYDNIFGSDLEASNRNSAVKIRPRTGGNGLSLYIIKIGNFCQIWVLSLTFFSEDLMFTTFPCLKCSPNVLSRGIRVLWIKPANIFQFGIYTLTLDWKWNYTCLVIHVALSLLKVIRWQYMLENEVVLR